LQQKLQNAIDPNISESLKLTNMVNNSIFELNKRKMMAEELRNVLTAIIDLRSSCHMVCSSLDKV
jgi:hypothetical protein